MEKDYLDIKNTDGLLEESRAAANIGFTGKAAIHPSQLTTIHQAFTPTEKELLEATKIIEAYNKSPTGVTVLEGRLVEKPVVERMMRILAASEKGSINKNQ